MSNSLQEGLETLRDAKNDKRLLGMALISLHGALEEYIRNELAREIAVSESSGPRVGWQDLVDLWQRHRELSPNDRDLILSKNTLRNKVAHAKPYRISRAEIETYAQFVQNFMGVHPAITPKPTLTTPPSKDPPQFSRSTTPSLSTTPQTPVFNNNLTEVVQRRPKRKMSCVGRLVLLFIVIIFTSLALLLLSSGSLSGFPESIQSLSESLQEKAEELLPNMEDLRSPREKQTQPQNRRKYLISNKTQMQLQHQP